VSEGGRATAASLGLSEESIGAVLVRDGGRLAAKLGLPFAEGHREASGLLAKVMNISRAGITARHREPIHPNARSGYNALVERRSRGEPYAYLVGTREFYGLDFLVTPAVMIPRPETELLLEAALERLPADVSRKVLDLGAGSGVLAIALARLRPLARVTAVDVSTPAIAVARTNAARLATGRVRLEQGSWYSPLAGERFDLIVSNPPYIARGDPHLVSGDLRYEPHAALDGGADGLDCIREIVDQAPAHLRGGGWLLLEHGYDQAEQCRALLSDGGFIETFSVRDLAGIERVSSGRIESR
jgi:release factor glutamine methyltransferase